MFEKKETQNVNSPQPKPKLEPYEIHVMPPKFNKNQGGVKKGGRGRFTLIIVIGLIILGALSVGAYYLFLILQGQTTGQPVNYNLPQISQNLNVSNQNLNAVNLNVANANVNSNVNANLNTNLNANQNLNLNLNTNANANMNVNENANANLNVNAPVTGNFFPSQDTDHDGLTDTEEVLYGTNKNLPDTDADGFLDGAELINLYDPTRGNGALLINSGLVNVYTNPVFNYQIFYPAKWLARPTDQSLTQVIFQSSTDEYISVSVQDNPKTLALVNWFTGQFPNVDLNLLGKATTKGGLEALISADKLTYYLYSDKTPDKVYVVNYYIDNRTEVNFLTTFAMMINSFQIVPKT